MAVFRARIVLEDIRGKNSVMNLDLGDFGNDPATDFPAALAALNQIAGALDPVTDMVIRETSLTSIVDTSADPGAGSALERAMLNVYLDAAGTKVAQVYVPAPSQAIFAATSGPNYDAVDTANTDVIQFVQQLSQHAFISDGEQVDTTTNNGIKNGIRVGRNLKLVDI